MTSWADQWDTGADPSPRARGGNGNGGGEGNGKKLHGGVEKTKAVAATGLKKVKAGTSQGFQWIKEKYQKKNAGSKNGKHGGGSEVAAGY